MPAWTGWVVVLELGAVILLLAACAGHLGTLAERAREGDARTRRSFPTRR